jgi:hypothetical protein
MCVMEHPECTDIFQKFSYPIVFHCVQRRMRKSHYCCWILWFHLDIGSRVFESSAYTGGGDQCAVV